MRLQIFPAISEEFLKRFYAPIFIILLGLSSSLSTTSSKDIRNYKFKNFKIFSRILLLIISEISLSSNVENLDKLIFYFFIPITFFFIIYIFLYYSLSFKKGVNLIINIHKQYLLKKFLKKILLVSGIFLINLNY